MRMLLPAVMLALVGCSSFTTAEQNAEIECQKQGKHAKLKEPLPPGVGIMQVEWVCVTDKPED